MGSLYKLITKTNLKSPMTAFPLIFPLIMILMYSVLIPEDLSVQEVNSAILIVLMTAISLITMQSGLMGFGFNFVKLKKSVMLRRIGATKLSKTDVLGAVVLYGLTIWLISMIWIFIWGYIFSSAGLFYSIKDGNHVVGHLNILNIDWPMFIGATIVMVLISYSIGLFFASFAKNDSVFQAIVMTYFFSVGLLGGLMIPGVVPDWMIYVGYVIPHSYANELYGIATGSVVVGYAGTNPEIIYISQAKEIADFIVPIVLSFVITFGAIKILKFD